MLDLGLYDRIRLSRHPWLQKVIAEGFLRFDYRKVDLRVEGLSNLPNEPVVLAMNHTDDFNYWPLQYRLHLGGEYTATWVKGKNYEHPALSTFMRLSNNIPVASRGYLLTRDFMNVMGRRPEPSEYRALRLALDELEAPGATTVPREVLETRRDMLGRTFEPTREPYHVAMEALMRQLMGRFVELNEQAHALGLHILVFPQGTRSKRLSRGHMGLAQMALHLGAPIVPVGCSGSDLVYPGRSIVCKPGRIIYRIGKPMRDLSEIAPTESFEPFTREAEADHGDAFQGIVDRVMDAINELVDEPYRYTDDRVSDGTSGTDRFV